LMSVPTVADGRVFTAYPVDEAAEIGKFETPAEDDAEEDDSEEDDAEEDDAEEEDAEDTESKDTKPVVPSYVLICCDARSGKTLWQRWIDTEVMSAPVAAGERLYVTTYSGTLYEFNQADGKILAARRLRATSAPVVVGEDLFYTRRTDSADQGEEKKIAEAIVRFDRNTGLEKYTTCIRTAPYLDWRIQEKAKSTVEAAAMEAPNAIGGGFGGGFFAVSPENPDEPEPTAGPLNVLEPSQQADAPKVSAMDEKPQDQLAVTQRVAADVVGQGNVSMLQSYHGSRVLPLGDRIVSCMGNVLVCVAVDSGKLLWSHQFSGDLETEGGYMAPPPVL
ncbi:hypothetical protein LCGC14_3168020, partial [marine sediment metagenome]